MKPARSNPPSDGRRSRPLLLLERTMYRDGRTPFTAVFTIKLAGTLDEGRLRQALARMQAKHPLLRCVVEETAGGPRFVLLDRPAPIPLRIVERGGEDDWQTEARREWVTPFDAGREPLVRLVWLRAGEVNELLLVGHHCICDGYSGINLMRECLSVYDQPEQNLGAYDALGAIGDIVPAALLEDRRFRRRVRWKAGILRLVLFLKQRSGKRSGPPIAAEQMYFHRWDTGNATAQALTECCRSEGVTVLAAVSVAFLQAFRDVRGARGLAKACTMVNARRFLPELRADAMFGLAPGVALRTKGLPLPRDMSIGGFWSRARAIKADLTRRIDRLGAGLYDKLVGLEGLHDKYDSLVDFFESAPTVRNVTLSNLGRLDLPQQYRSFRLERVYTPLVMVSPTPANTVVISSFAGRMEFAIISDEQSLPRAQALEIQQRAMEILRTCVAIPAQYNAALGNERSAMRPETT
ncbi:MAG: condensation domain protein [Bryobacterales bacterium]|nr:condensation domain protein [Bryobacterales bacterium]